MMAQKSYFKYEGPDKLKMKGMKNIYHENGNTKKVAVAILTSKSTLEQDCITKDFILINPFIKGHKYVCT